MKLRDLIARIFGKRPQKKEVITEAEIDAINKKYMVTDTDVDECVANVKSEILQQLCYAKLATMLDPLIWQDPKRSIDALKNRGVFDYRNLAHYIIREGTPLSKAEKKQYGIHPLTKVGSKVHEHFTEKGLSVCLREAQQLALAISSIEITSDTVSGWKKMGMEKIEFAPAPDACEACRKLAGVYDINVYPTPVADTHLGCRCSFKPV